MVIFWELVNENCLRCCLGRILWAYWCHCGTRRLRLIFRWRPRLICWSICWLPSICHDLNCRWIRMLPHCLGHLSRRQDCHFDCWFRLALDYSQLTLALRSIDLANCVAFVCRKWSLPMTMLPNVTMKSAKISKQ